MIHQRKQKLIYLNNAITKNITKQHKIAAKQSF